MARSYLDTNLPIAAPATAPGQAAIAVVRVSGRDSIRLASACFSAREALEAAPGFSLKYGSIIDPETGGLIDKGIVSVFRAPHSFTGEDSVEFSCHGSPAVVDALMRVLEKQGIARALPGEFTFRAFLNGKTDLVEAEAVDELARASCEAARQDALQRLGGALSEKFNQVRDKLLDLLAELEARLDYPDDEGPEHSDGDSGAMRERITAALRPLEELAASYAMGRIRKEGLLVVAAGRPNAGKSSLFNLMVREERAIVSPEPGTTRDWIEAWIELDGLALRLVDTAGLRQADGTIESEGVRRAMDLVQKADVLLYLVDGRSGLDAADEEFLALHPDSIKLWNKIDDPGCLPSPPGWIGLSAKFGRHIEELERQLGMAIARNHAPSLEGVRIANARQKNLVDRAVASLKSALAGLEAHAPLDAISPDIRDSSDALGEITGEFTGENVFERIFGKFCLGK